MTTAISIAIISNSVSASPKSVLLLDCDCCCCFFICFVMLAICSLLFSSCLLILLCANPSHWPLQTTLVFCFILTFGQRHLRHTRGHTVCIHTQCTYACCAKASPRFHYAMRLFLSCDCILAVAFLSSTRSRTAGAAGKQVQTSQPAPVRLLCNIPSYTPKP